MRKTKEKKKSVTFHKKKTLRKLTSRNLEKLFDVTFY